MLMLTVCLGTVLCLGLTQTGSERSPVFQARIALEKLHHLMDDAIMMSFKDIIDVSEDTDDVEARLTHLVDDIAGTVKQWIEDHMEACLNHRVAVEDVNAGTEEPMSVFWAFKHLFSETVAGTELGDFDIHELELCHDAWMWGDLNTPRKVNPIADELWKAITPDAELLD